MQKVLITWVSSWIWNYLANNLNSKYKIFWISRNDPKLENIYFFSCDLTNFNEINNFVNKIKNENIYFDSIIFNAGVWFFDEFENISADKNLQTLQTNLYAPIFMLQHLLNNLNKNAKLIFVWSIAAKKFFKLWAVYQASKFWIRWFAWSIKNELKDYFVCIINPNIVKTNFFWNNNPNINFRETKLNDILKVVENVLTWKENRFEIDL
jgi:short-subunit dehydrogenase